MYVEIPSFGRKFGDSLAGLLTINSGHIINPSNPALVILPVQAVETNSIFVGSYDIAFQHYIAQEDFRTSIMIHLLSIKKNTLNIPWVRYSNKQAQTEN